MNLTEMKKKVLAMIEELSPDHEKLTEDPDISTKMNDVINQVMFELCRLKKLPKYVELPVSDGDVITFGDIGEECGHEVYQVGTICGIHYMPKANGTVFKVTKGGTAEIDCYVFPKRITEENENTYEFELTADVLEIMPYGVAADLLKSDVSSEYGAVYEKRYQTLLSALDPRYQMNTVYIEGGVSV